MTAKVIVITMVILMALGGIIVNTSFSDADEDSPRVWGSIRQLTGIVGGEIGDEDPLSDYSITLLDNDNITYRGDLPPGISLVSVLLTSSNIRQHQNVPLAEVGKTVYTLTGIFELSGKYEFAIVEDRGHEISEKIFRINVTDNSVNVAEIKVTSSRESEYLHWVYPDSIVTVTAVVYPSDADIIDLTWTISNDSTGIVEILSETKTATGGEVTIRTVEEGNVYIQATATDGTEKFGYAHIFVTDTPRYAPSPSIPDSGDSAAILLVCIVSLFAIILTIVIFIVKGEKT